MAPQNVRLATDLLVELNLGQNGYVIRAPQGSPLMTMATLGQRHLLLLPM